MKNINKKIIIPIIIFIFLVSAIIIRIAFPSYALEEINDTCNHNNTLIEEAYITADNGIITQN